MEKTKKKTIEHSGFCKGKAVIRSVCSKVCHFSTFFAHFGLPWVRPWDTVNLHGSKENSMLVKRIAAYTHLYLQLFRPTSYSEILIGNCNFFLPLAFNAPVGGVPIGIPGKGLDLRKLESWGYHRQ